MKITAIQSNVSSPVHGACGVNRGGVPKGRRGLKSVEG